MSAKKTGFLILADISGFTEFLTSTELEHGPPIIAELLEEVIRRIAPPLEVHGIEGDAVFALGPDGTVLPPASLRAVLRAGFEGFRTKQRELAGDFTASGSFRARPAGCIGLSAGGTLDVAGVAADVPITPSCP